MRTMILLFLMAAAIAPGQTVLLKDGRALTVTRVRRQGDQITLQAASNAEMTVAVGEIARIDFPEPPEISEVAEGIVAGKAAEAVPVLERMVNAQADFQEIPGNWWALASLRMAQALESQGSGLEAQAVLDKITQVSLDGELARAAEAQKAAILLRRGDRAGAVRLVDRVLQESQGALARAIAFVVKGQCLLAEEKWEDAMLSFLQVPVFYPGESIQMPAVLLGRGRAELGMEDYAAARATLEELRLAYPGASEAKLALQELQRVNARERGESGAR